MKIAMAKALLDPNAISLAHQSVDLPEIQSLSVEEIASFSANYAAQELNKEVLVTDVGYYIDALNGFPGPFIKFTNQSLTSDDILRLMHGKENRRVEIRECVAYSRPNHNPVTFTSVLGGEIGTEVKGNTTIINNVMVMDGCDKTVSEMTEAEIMTYITERHMHFGEFAEYYLANSVQNS